MAKVPILCYSKQYERKGFLWIAPKRSARWNLRNTAFPKANASAIPAARAPISRAKSVLSATAAMPPSPDAQNPPNSRWDNLPFSAAPYQNGLPLQSVFFYNCHKSVQPAAGYFLSAAAAAKSKSESINLPLRQILSP